MHNPMLSKFPAGVDLRGVYERELEEWIEGRRIVARARLEASENALRQAITGRRATMIITDEVRA
jgi:hypothetical protein